MPNSTKKPGSRGRRPSRKKWRDDVLSRLSETYPDAVTELDYQNEFQLLVAVVLSAQTTDVRVNIVTPALFERFPTPQALAEVEPKAVEPYIATVGLYRNKSKHLVGLGKMLSEQHGGQVPKTRGALEALPGVGRKTANVVLSCAMGVPAIAVDTHVFRVSQRLGLADAKTVRKVEDHLMASIPKALWSDAHHWLILHGRRICKARKPTCDVCPIEDVCLARQEEMGGKVPPWLGKVEWAG